jgi:hypothetical protein
MKLKEKYNNRRYKVKKKSKMRAGTAKKERDKGADKGKGG